MLKPALLLRPIPECNWLDMWMTNDKQRLYLKLCMDEFFLHPPTTKLVGLAYYQGKAIVFRFIIGYIYELKEFWDPW